jgi:hypothetical protein
MKQLVFLAVVLGASAVPRSSVRAGVAIISPERCVVAIEGPVLPAGTKLIVVTVGSPQRAQATLVKTTVAEPGDMAKHDTGGPYYEVECSRRPSTGRDVGVVVVGQSKVKLVGGAVALDLGGQYSDVRVRACTSTEGVHLTLWSGPVLKSPRLWHAYFYLGYEVKPTCRPEDYHSGG